MSVTVTRNLSPYGWTLAATLREILAAGGGACRIEHKPASPFTGDPEFNSTSLSAWTQTNSANADTIDANTTYYIRLYINSNATSTNWSGATRTGPFVNQTISGDFDIYARVEFGTVLAFYSAQLIAQSTSNASDWVMMQVFFNSIAPLLGGIFRSCDNDVNTDSSVVAVAGPVVLFGGFVWIRLKRAGNVFSGYYSLDSKTWTQVGANATRADFSSDQKSGFACITGTTANTGAAACDFLRTWPPFDTTSPSASKVFDSGVNGTTWDMSTFIALENEYKEYSPQSAIGFGTFKYQYGAGNSNPPSLNGSWLTATQMLSETDPTGRYFKLSVEFISANGYELSSFNGAMIDTIFSAGGVMQLGGMTGGLQRS